MIRLGMSLEAAARAIGADAAQARRQSHVGFDSVEWRWKPGCYFGLMAVSDTVIGFYGFERISDAEYRVINEKTGEWRPVRRPPSRGRVQADGSIPIP